MKNITTALNHTSVQNVSPLRQWLRQLWRHRTGRVAFAVVAVFFGAAVAIEAYTLFCEARTIVPVYAIENPEQRFAAPSAAHWLGTDYLGRDCLYRAVAGIATAVKVGVIAGVIAAVIGVALGMIAGYFGGWVDDLIVWFYSVFASMPALLFILAFALLFTRGFLSPELAAALARLGGWLHADIGMLAVYLAIGLTGWVTLCRVARAETMKLKNQAFVQAAKVAGLGNGKIIRRHILPNLMHLVIIYFTLRFGYAIMTEVIVSYLGLGVQSAPSWGVMIADGQERLWRGVWHEVAAASGFMLILVLALNMLGDALRDILDPRLNRD